MRTLHLILAVVLAVVSWGGVSWAGYEFPISTDPAFQGWPDIYGNIVVWTDFRTSSTTSSDIYAYDLSTGEEFPITTAPGDQGFPVLSGTIVVWEDGRNSSVSGMDIYGYNLATHTEFPITTAPGDQVRPAISGGIVVWEDGRNLPVTSTDIYGYNLSTQVEFPIRATPASQASPAISGNIVVWQEPAWPVGDIWGSDLSTGQQFLISGAPRAQMSPALSGNIVVWQDHRDDPTADEINLWLFLYPNICGYNLATSAEFQVNTAGSGYSPDISGNVVAWEDTRHGYQCMEGPARWWCKKDVYARALPAGQETRLSNLSTIGEADASPAVSGNVVVWAASGDIWGYVLDGAVPPGPLPAPSNLTAVVATTTYPWRVHLTWSDNSADEMGFNIERKEQASGTYARIRIVAANTAAYSDTEYLYRGRTYYYRVRAYRGDVNSNYSNEASVTIPSFDDVPATASYWRYVEAIARQAITQGCSIAPPLYCPYNYITRAQMAVFLCRAAGKGPLDRETPTFCDVPKTSPYYGWIERLADPDSWGGNPPTIGCAWLPCRQYCPGKSVTRDEIAAFLVRATGRQPVTSCAGIFADVDRGGWACPFIERIADPASWPGGVAITNGCAVNPLRYCPKSAVTRGQMAVFLVRAFGIPL